MSRFLTIVNGARRLASAITSSLGSADGNKIVATKSNGRLDNSLIEWASPSEIGSTTPSTGKFTTLRTTRSFPIQNGATPTQVFEVDGTPAFGIYAIGQASNPSAQSLRFITLNSSTGDGIDTLLEFTKNGGVSVARGAWSFTSPIILPRNTAAPDPFYYTRGLSFVGASDATAYLNYSLAGTNFRVLGMNLLTETVSIPYSNPTNSSTTGVIVTPGGIACGSLNVGGHQINAPDIPKRLFVQNTAQTVTGTTNPVTVASYTIPANTLTPNSCLLFEMLFTLSSNAINKTVRLKIGSVIIWALTVTTNNHSLIKQLTLRNQDAMNSQVTVNLGAASYGASTSGILTFSIDFTVAQTVTVEIQNNGTAEVSALRGFSILHY